MLMAIRVIRSYKTITGEETADLVNVISFQLATSASAKRFSKVRTHFEFGKSLTKCDRSACRFREQVVAQNACFTKLISKHMCRPFVEAILDS